MKRDLFFIILVAFIYSAITFVSCKKNGDTTASVTVQDTLGLPVAGATVTLWQDTAHNPITNAQGIVHVSAVTNTSGTATFTFANEAFLNIWATQPLLFPDDTAKGFIRLEQYKTTTATVKF